MNGGLRHIIGVGCIMVMASLGVIAAEGISVKVANLSEDVVGLAKEVAQLRLEVELLSREKEALRRQLEVVGALESELKLLKSRQEGQVASMEAYKKVLLKEVSEEMENFSKQTQRAMDQFAKSFAGKGGVQEAVVFSDDYAKEGVEYKVKPGDSLSLIAQQQGSTVRDIQNANRIVDPRELKAGQVIFIPTKK